MVRAAPVAKNLQIASPFDPSVAKGVGSADPDHPVHGARRPHQPGAGAVITDMRRRAASARRLRGSGGKELRHNRLHEATKRAETKIRAPMFAPVFTKLTRAGLIRQQFDYSAREIAILLEIDIIAGDAVKIDLLAGVMGGGDHRHAASHGFDIHQAKTFPTTWHRENMRPRPERVYLALRQKARKFDIACRRRSPRPEAQYAETIAAAGDQQPRIGYRGHDAGPAVD